MSYSGHSPEFIKAVSLPKISDTQMKCLVATVFYEAFREGEVGRLLVAKVVLNRAGDVKGLCKVVYKKSQFSWTRLPVKKIPESARLKIAREVDLLYRGFKKVPQRFENSTHFHNTTVSPAWRHELLFSGQWKGHKFYASNLRKIRYLI
jgi:spore germination cell wall hydrolase CwlJ-like protein